MEYYSAMKRNAFESVLMRCLKLEPIKQWSQSEREGQILYINTHIWNLERRYWWSCMQGSKGDADVKNRLLDSIGDGEGGMIWENSDDMYITMCKIDDRCKFDAWSRAPKASALGQPSGKAGEWRWEECSGWGRHMYSCGEFMLMYGKNHHNIVIILQLHKLIFKKKKKKIQ